MLVLTSSATEAIREIVTSSGMPDFGGVRITLEPIDAETAKLDMSVAESAEPGDERVEQGGANVFVDQTAATVLSGKILDATVRGDGVEFSIIDPPANPSPNGHGPH